MDNKIAEAIDRLNNKFVHDTGADPVLGIYLTGYNDGISVAIDVLRALKTENGGERS